MPAPDQTILLPSSAQLSGSVIDDGFPNSSGGLTILWSKVSGAGDVTFSDAGTLNSTASFSEVGNYILRLSASDGDLLSEDEVSTYGLPVLPQQLLMFQLFSCKTATKQR